MTLGENIKKLREENKMSMMQLAKILNVSDAGICKWENGQHEPKASYIVAIANYFGITTDELLGRENYATGIVEVVGEQLTNDEKELLELYRKMNFQNKNQLIGFAKGLIY